MPAPCLKPSQPTIACEIFSTILSLDYKALHAMAPAHLSSLILHSPILNFLLYPHTPYSAFPHHCSCPFFFNAWIVLLKLPHITLLCLTNSPVVEDAPKISPPASISTCSQAVLTTAGSFTLVILHYHYLFMPLSLSLDR